MILLFINCRLNTVLGARKKQKDDAGKNREWEAGMSVSGQFMVVSIRNSPKEVFS